MQSHGGPELVAELPQSLKNQQRTERLIQMVESNVRYGSKADPPHRTILFLLCPRSGHPSTWDGREGFMSTRPKWASVRD